MNSKVEIYGTLGPACASREVLEQMFQVGLTGMRLNLSHTGLRESSELIDAFRQAAAASGVKPQLLIDMQGPELRVGKMDTVELKTGDSVIFRVDGAECSSKECDSKDCDSEECSSTKCGNAEKYPTVIPVPAAVLSEMQPGDEVLLNDGKILLKVLHDCAAKVLRGGTLSSHKSVKLVGRQIELPVLTEHDINNLKLAGEYGVTGLMQPFVKSGEDLKRVREVLAANNAGDVKIFAKIENRAALKELDNIIDEADVIIIARGDLGNDMDLWELPAVQKNIEKVCLDAGKPFIVVTQMLASMEENPVPTRAEVSDIFNAVADGAYGVMITGESAVGKYPVEAVKYLANTARVALPYQVGPGFKMI